MTGRPRPPGGACRRRLLFAAALAVAIFPASLAAQEESGTGPAPAAGLIERVTEHIRRADALRDELQVPDFPAGKEWFNSPPLSFRRELQGKVAVLDFWTYCCINCIHVLPDLAALEAKYAGQPVAFVGVHSAKFENERGSENIRSAVLRYEIRHPVVNDDEMKMWRAIGVRSWPTLVVVGPRGNLLLLASGEGQKDLLDAAIAAALKFYPPEAFRHEPLPVTLEKDRQRLPSPLRFPGKLATDPAGGRLFISDSNHNRIVVVDLDGKFLDAIGGGRAGLRDGSFAEAAFRRPQGVACDGERLYVADAENHALRLVDLRARTVTTLAGDGTQGRDYTGGGKGGVQRLSTPWDVAVHEGTVFIAMAGTHQIWEHEIATGVTRAWSGTGRERNLNHADRLQADWAQPSGLGVGEGRLFVADSESSSVRAVDLATGATRGLAGGDAREPANLFAFGDVDAAGDAARFQHPLGVLWLAPARRVLVADTYNHRLKLIDPESGAAAAWAGSGKAGLADGEALDARFAEPAGLALAPGGRTVYVADTNNHAIRAVDLESRRVRTLELRGVPAPLPPAPPRSERLANLPETPTVRTEPLRLAPGGAGKIVVRLALPPGHHYCAGAPSRWQLLAAGELPAAVEEERASGALAAGAEVVIPVTASTERKRGALLVEALAYYSRENDSCRAAAVLIEVPVEVGEGGKDADAVAVTHAFPGGAGGPADPGGR